MEIENEQEEEVQTHELDDHERREKLKGRFMDIHLYFTQALQRNDIRAVGMHLAMDLLAKVGIIVKY